MGGFLYISTIVISIGATAGVLYREVVRWWEGPLWEVPLYMYNTAKFDNTLSLFVFVMECVKLVNCLRLQLYTCYLSERT